MCDSLYYAPQVIYPFSAKSAWSRFIGTCLSHLILLLPTSSSCLTALRGVPLHNIVYTCARWPAPPVWLSLYFGQLTQVNVMGHVLSEIRSSKSASKCAACHLLLILCTVPSAACARTTVARDQPTPATQTVTLPSTAAVSPAWTAPMARVVWCRDGGLCLVVF